MADFLGAIDGDGDVDPGDILDGKNFEVPSACEKAAEFADRNDADVVSCEPAAGVGYVVGVVSRDTVGESLIPGTETEQARAEATAVIRGLCQLASEDDADEVELDCDDEDDISFDPEEDDELPEARDLFDVYLDD